VRSLIGVVVFADRDSPQSSSVKENGPRRQPSSTQPQCLRMGSKITGHRLLRCERANDGGLPRRAPATGRDRLAF
jgi:hypothetical protein